jgi:hypothetical protein
MTRHLATSTPDKAATSAAATAPPVAINNHAGQAEAGCKRQVEQQFERRCGAVRLMRIASSHPPRVVRDDADAGLHRPPM